MRGTRVVLLCLVLVAVGVGTASGLSLGDKLSSAWDSTKGFFGNLGSNISEAFGKLKDKLLDKFPTMSDKIKDFLNRQTFDTATADDLLNDMPTEAWKEIQPAMLMSARKTEMMKLINTGGEKVPTRFLNELNRLISANQTLNEALDLVKNDLSKCSEAMNSGGVIQPSGTGCTLNIVEGNTIMARLGDPNKWDKSNFTHLDVSLLKMPYCLETITNKTNMDEVIRIIKKCDVGSPPSGCPDKKITLKKIQNMNMAKLGAPSGWSKDGIVNMGGVVEIPKYVINSLSSTMVKDLKADVLGLSFDVNDEILNENWKRRICEADNCKSLTKDTVKTWYDSLGNLKPRIMPSDISAAAMENTEMATIFTNAAKARNEKIRPEDAKIIMEKALKDKKPETITQGEINAIGGNTMMYAPACFLKAAQEEKLNGIITKATQTLETARGPEFMPKVRALMTSNMGDAMSDTVFTQTKIKEQLKPLIRFDLLRNQDKNILKQVVNAAQQYSMPMEKDQIDAVLSKVNAEDAKEHPGFIRSSLPTSILKATSIETLAKLSKDIEYMSLPCLKGATKTFGTKTTIDATAIKTIKDFLKCMSAEDAKKIKYEEIFEVFEEIGDSAVSSQACRVMAEKLEEWGKTNLKEDDDVFKMLYMDEIRMLPPCMIDYADMDLDEMSPAIQSMYLRRICNNPGYFMMSQIGRREVVNSLLSKELGSNKLTTCDLEKLGLCAADLNSAMLNKMDEGAKEVYLIIQQEFHISNLACLDSSQQSALAGIIETIKGAPSTWNTAEDVSCLLYTMSSSKQAAIPEGAFTSASCPRMITSFNTIMPKKCMDDLMAAEKTLMERQTDRCMTMRSDAGFNTKCDKISCGGIVAMSTSELSQMPADEVWSNVEGLTPGNLPMDKGRTILSKIKEKKALKDMTSDDLTKLGSLWKAFTKQDIEDVPAFEAAKSEKVVYNIGQLKDLKEEEGKALLDKVMKEYKDPKDMASKDVVTLGNLMCHMPKDKLDTIPSATIEGSMRNLGDLKCGTDYNKIKDLGDRVETAYKDTNDAVSDASGLDAAQVSEMNWLTGALKPESLASLKPAAFAGITPDGIKALSSDHIKALKLDQIENLSLSAASAVTPDQKSHFNAEMKAAFDKLLGPGTQDSGATEVTVSRVLTAVCMVVFALMA